MRTRFTTMLLAILGMGVPVLMAWFLRREERAAPMPSAPMPSAPPAPSGGRPPIGPDGHVPEPHPTGMFAALGRFTYRFRRWLPAVGLALVIGLNVGASQAGGELIQGGWVIEGSEEQMAAELLADRFGEQATTMLIVYRDPAGVAASVAVQA